MRAEVDIDKLMYTFEKQQERLIHRTEYCICAGLERMAIVRFGAQSREYFQENKRERGAMKEDMTTMIVEIMDRTNEHILKMWAEQENQQDQVRKHQIEKVMDSLESSHKTIADTMTESLKSVSQTMS